MSATSTTTANATNNAQKDYHALNNGSGVGNSNSNNSNSNGSGGGERHQHLNRLKSSSNSSINTTTSSINGGGSNVGGKRIPLVPDINGTAAIDQMHLHQHQHQQRTLSNGLFVANPFRFSHLHNHQRGSMNNSSISSSTSSLIMRKSYPSSDPSNSSFSSASVAGSIQDDNMSDQCGLTQAGLEEYNSRSYYDQPVFHHQKQSSYAQSEGYHSYVSSSDSSSATPFLDRLRQETELLSRQSHHWSQNDLSPSANNNNSTNPTTNPTIDNNSNESTSSTETLKWLGSTSDISVASHATNSSAISGSVSSSSQLIVHSSRVLTPKRHNSESVLYMNDDQMSVTSDSTGHNNNNCSKSAILYQQHPRPSPLQHYHSPGHKASGVDHQHHNHSANLACVVVSSPPTIGLVSSSAAPSQNSPNAASSLSPHSPSSIVTSTVTSTAAVSPSLSSSSSSYRRLFPVSTYAEPVNGNTATSPDYQHKHHHLQQQHSGQPYQSPPQTNQPQQQQNGTSSNSSQQSMTPIKLPSPQPHNWQSVADRINDFERQQQHIAVHHHHNHQQQPPQQQPLPPKYSFIDPSKTHRVPNPALKAFQKNAVQSYFERQQQNAVKQPALLPSLNNHHHQNRPQSLQLPNSPKDIILPHMRSSLPNNCTSGNYNHRSAGAQQIINGHLISPDDSISSYLDGSTNGMPPPPPPRSRSLMPVRRTSSASEYSEFRESFMRAKDRMPGITPITSPEKMSFNDCGVPSPPPPPPRGGGGGSSGAGRVSMPVRRTSSASEYVAFREKNMKVRKNLHAAMIMGPIISLDDWVPERPPKNPNLRIPSPDLPPPPVLAIDTDSNLLNQDEPLPPPPPEILRHMRQNSDGDNSKPPSPNHRRNSFAGSPSRKHMYRATTFENLSPPAVPRKPSPIDLMHSRPASSMAHSHKAHKVILNGKLESPTSPNCPRSPGSPHQTTLEPLSRICDPRASVRKRSHNSYPTPPPPIDCKLSSKPSTPTAAIAIKSPPPLKPRMPIVGQEMRASSVAISSKLRRNSKASYLPRQTTDKLINATDPDHGSYKLTLTSNEDSINHSTSSFHDDILSSKCNNLPDVLPVGVKVQASPPSSSSSSPRYGSNNNINMVTPPHTAPAMMSGSYPMKSMFHFQPPTTQHNRILSSPISTSPPSYSIGVLNRNPNSPMNSNDSISPKYMSQSTIDLKKTHVFDSTIEDGTKLLSPAQSESNILAQEKPRSPFSIKREFRKTEVSRKLSLDDKDKNEGRIVRAELVNTVLSTSPSPPANRLETKPICKDSLRGNIEKITQLQSKLMSAHLIENGPQRTLLGYTAKTVEIKSKIIEKEPMIKAEPKSPTPRNSPTAALTSILPEIAESNERISKMDSEVDGLKLMQRTEIILRLNAPTSEAASQTDETLESELSRIKLGDSVKETIDESTRSAADNGPKSPPPIELRPRQRHPEEIDCDNLLKDLIEQLSATDKLHQIFAPKNSKSTADYVSGLYNPKIMSRPIKRDVSTSTPERKSDKSVGCELEKTSSVEESKETDNRNGPVVVSESIDKKIAKRVSHRDVALTNGDCADLTKKKEELVNRLTKKLLVLGNEQNLIADEISTNDQLGSDLTTKVAEKLRQIDATKFRAYIDDVGHITLLLLSLSGRLAKVENTLQNGIENSAEKKILDVKRDRLSEQLEEAKRLKEDIDRRGTVVSKILEKNLTADECSEYDYFINMKAKLIVDSRENADKIKLGEEQLKALKDTLSIQSDC